MNDKGVVAHREFNRGGCMTDDEIIASAHKYIEFDRGKIDGATLNAELAKCRDPGELIAVGTAYKMLKGSGLAIRLDTPTTRCLIVPSRLHAFSPAALRRMW
jgi:hypothetical protein